MKKTIGILIIALVLSSCVSSKNGGRKKAIKFDKNTFEEVLDRAKEEDKIVFVDFWASWCGPCLRMDEEVLSQKVIIDFFSENFISTKIDAESEDAILPKINYDVRSLPTYVWVLPSGKMIHYYKGTTTVENFLEQAKIALSRK